MRASVFVAAMLAMACWPPVAGARQPGSRIGAIHVQGQRVFSAEQVIAATGLKRGQVFDAEKLNAVAERLGKSGAFSDITYTYAGQAGLMNIEFKVEEGKFRACHFDNFVWLSDEEIDTRLRKELPLYNGTLPETGEMLEEVPAVLEKLSAEKGVTVRVSRRVQQRAIGDPNWSHMYSADGANAKVQAVRFTGTLTVSQEDLQKEAARIVGRDYSAFQSALFGTVTVESFFTERGYLRVRVDAPAMKVVGHAAGTREFAVEVAYGVTEGELFHWKAAEWTGDAILPAPEMEALTGMKPNDVANAKKINEGWMAVKSAYGKRGYMEAQLNPQPVFEEGAPVVHYRVAIAQGPQYHMGSFSVTGVPDGVAERVKSRWKLKAGDVYDASYPSDFLKKDAVGALQGAVRQGSRFGLTTRPNRERHTVDVTMKVE